MSLAVRSMPTATRIATVRVGTLFFGPIAVRLARIFGRVLCVPIHTGPGIEPAPGVAQRGAAALLALASEEPSQADPNNYFEGRQILQRPLLKQRNAPGDGLRKARRFRPPSNPVCRAVCP